MKTVGKRVLVEADVTPGRYPLVGNVRKEGAATTRLDRWRPVQSMIVLDGPDTSALLRAAIPEAQHRLWITQFLIDVRGSQDRYGEVLSLVRLLAAAHETGLDVRVLLPRVYPTKAAKLDGIDANRPAVRLLVSAGVPVRYYGAPPTRPWLHAKPALVDDLIIIGNGNWTPNCFRLNSEMGLALRGTELAGDWARRFEHLWEGAEVPALDKARCSSSPSGSCPDIAKCSSSACTACPCAANGPAPSSPCARSAGCASPACSSCTCATGARRTAIDAGRRGTASRRTLAGNGADLLATLDLPASVDAQSSATLLAGQEYLRAVTALVHSAKERIWLSIFGLRAATTVRMHPLVDALAAASSRGVDVRILYDGDPRTLSKAAKDVALLAGKGAQVRPWPFRSRLHTRSLLVDNVAVVGSIGWTPASIFLTEELSVAVSGDQVTTDIAARLQAAWDLAGSSPRDWPVLACDWPASVVNLLADNAVTTLGDVLDRVLVPGVSGPSLGFLQRCASLIVTHQVPPAVAWLAAWRFDDGTLLGIAGLPRFALDELLRPARLPRTPRDLTPVGSYLASLTVAPVLARRGGNRHGS